MSNSQIKANRGSYIEFQMEWPNGGGGAADLTGYSVRLIDVSPARQFVPQVSFANQAAGLLDILIPWDDNMPDDRNFEFRIQIENDTTGVQKSTNLLTVLYE